MDRALPTRRIAGLLALVAVACSLDDPEFLGGSSGGVASTDANPGSGGSGSSGAKPFPPTSPEGSAQDDQQPARACGPADVEPDASVDAGSSDARDEPSNPDLDCMPPPAPVCGDDLHLVRFYLGYCVGGLCRWQSATTSCPGGCFRALDGVDRCNQN
jgi:hypothetical protein